MAESQSLPCRRIGNMISFTVNATGSAELIEKLKQAEKGVSVFKEEFEEAGKFLTNFETQYVFETEGQVFGEPWQPISEKYAQQKRKKYPNRGTLERTGDMRRNFVFTILNTNEALFHNKYDDDYLKYHNSNLPRKTKLPRRVLYKLDDERKRSIVEIFAKGVKVKLNKSFYG